MKGPTPYLLRACRGSPNDHTRRMTDPAQVLKDLQPEREFFIGVDSDGCAFDTMEIKHKECFCPNTIKYFKLQAASKYAREAWDFVNLYSK